ncbi:MAG: TetR/AcrR family transcriptional regulator [Aggregatilineales bacterium]
MARKSKHDWLIEALTVLAEVGAQGLTIDLLTERLGVTKGSFYHHFGSFAGFKEALLDFFESEGTLQIIDVTEQEATPEEKLQTLLDITASFPTAVEVAMRAWALQDEVVRAYQERIDARRIEYLRKLFFDLTGDAAMAVQRAQLLYVIYIGSQHVVPPIQGEDLIRHCAELTHLFYFTEKKQ